MRIFKREAPPETKTQETTELDQYRRAVREVGMPPDAVETTLKEIDRIAKMPSGSAEHTIGVNYLDYLTHLPWNRASEDRLDLKTARQVLDAEHDGLMEIKSRVMEHLAVKILRS